MADEETLSNKAQKALDQLTAKAKELAAKITPTKDTEMVRSAGATDLTSKVNCPEGYVHLYGNICIKKSIKAQADDIKNKVLPDLSGIQKLDSICRMAVEAMNAVSKSAENLLKVPGQLATALNKIVDYPFDKVKNMAKDALTAISEAKNDFLKDLGFDKSLGIISDLKKLKTNLDTMLSCPLMADTDIGKAAAEILDELDKGNDVTSKVKDLQNYITSYAEDVLENVESEALGQVAGIQQSIENAIKRSGVEDILQKLDGLSTCLNTFCDLTDTSSSLYSKVSGMSASSLADKAGLIWEKSTNSLKTTFDKVVEVEGQDLKEAWDDVKSIFKTADKSS